MATKDTAPATVSSSSGRTIVMRLSTMVKIALVIVLVGISFYGGYTYGSGKGDSDSDSSSSEQHHFALGLVVYVSSTSITIANQNNTLTKTYGITKSTIISINGAKAAASQIQAGNRVLIRLARNDPSKADAIIVDTNFSG